MDSEPGRILGAVEKAGIPVILLVGVSAMAAAERLRQAGRAAYLTKPLRRSRLRQALRQCLEPLNLNPESTSDRGRILVVDDNVTNLKVAELHLQALGFGCQMAESAQEALSILETEVFDIVLMDCEMPGVDGFEAVRQIRAREPQGTHQIVLALTAHSVDKARERATDAGMDGFLTKPLHREPLNAALSRWLLTSNSPPKSLSYQKIETPEKREDVDVTISLDPRAWEGLAYLEVASGAGAIQELVEGFSQDLPIRLQRMQAAWARGEMKDLGRLAHDLKSNSATLGLVEFSAHGAAIERAAMDGEIVDVHGILETCIAQTPAVISVLKRHIPVV